MNDMMMKRRKKKRERQNDKYLLQFRLRGFLQYKLDRVRKGLCNGSDKKLRHFYLCRKWKSKNWSPSSSSSYSLSSTDAEGSSKVHQSASQFHLLTSACMTLYFPLAMSQQRDPTMSVGKADAQDDESVTFSRNYLNRQQTRRQWSLENAFAQL